MDGSTHDQTETEAPRAPPVTVPPSALDLVIAQSQDCIKLLDASGRLAFMNSNGLRILAIDDFANVSGKLWRDMWPEESRGLIDEAVSRAVEGQASRFQAFCPTAIGETRWWDVSVSPILDQQGELLHILATSRDISYRYGDEGREELLRSVVRQLEEERTRLSKAQRELDHVEKLRILGQFSGEIVHDLNNILAVMSSASALLRGPVDKAVTGEILNHVDQAVTRGSELTRQLLDYSRNDAGAAEIVDLRQILARDEGMMRHLVGKAVTLTFECDDDAAPVLAPSSRIRSVLFNLVANSRDAIGGTGQITVRLGSRILFGRTGDMAAGSYTVLEIEDDGCGMPPEVVAQLGRAFFTTKASGKGTGLGIPSAYELAQMCGGAVEIDSEPGRGTTIRLVLGASPARGGMSGSAAGRIDLARHGDATILLVENNELLRQHLAAWLQSLGYAVLEAAAGSVAIATALTATKVDLLLSDIMLDDSDGQDVAARVREMMPDIPVIFLTGTGGMGIPASEVVMRKPIDEAVLAQLILEQLGRLPARRLTDQLLGQSARLKGRLNQPAMIAAYDAWQEQCAADRRLPSLEFLAPLAETLGDSGYLVKISGTFDVPTFRFVMASPRLEARLDRRLLDSFVTSADEDALGSVGRAMARAKGGVAYYDYTRLRTGDTRAQFERLLLPLSENGIDVTHLYGIVMIDQ